MSTRKLQILQTTSTCLQQSTDNKITTAILAKKVGVSEAGLYRYFKSKNAIFAELMRFLDERLIAQLQQILATKSADPQATLYQFHETILLFFTHNPGLSKLFLGHMSALELIEKSQLLKMRLQQMLTQYIKECVVNKSLPKNSLSLPTHLIYVIYGAISCYQLTKYQMNLTDDLRQQWVAIKILLKADATD